MSESSANVQPLSPALPASFPIPPPPCDYRSIRKRHLLLASILCTCLIPTPLLAQQEPPRQITADLHQALTPVDHFYDLSVGSDYPGTLIRDDSQAQLKLAVDELGFRYLRFHAIFHDVLVSAPTSVVSRDAWVFSKNVQAPPDLPQSPTTIHHPNSTNFTIISTSQAAVTIAQNYR